MQDFRGQQALWILSAALLSFAGDGLQNLFTALIGHNSLGFQAGMVGCIAMGACCIQHFALKDPPRLKPKPRKRRKPKPKPPQT